MDLQYLINASDIGTLPPGRILVDTHARLWHRTTPVSPWTDGTGREKTSLELLIMRGPVYLLPEGFTGALTLDDLSDAEAGDFVLDCHGDHWGKTTGRWLLDDGVAPSIIKTSEDLLDIYGPLLPAPRPGDVYSPILPAPRPGDVYARPVPAMEAAAREEEARPVSFWRRLWNGLVWG